MPPGRFLHHHHHRHSHVNTHNQVLTSGVINFLQLYNSALIVRLVLTWFPNPPEAIVTPLA